MYATILVHCNDRRRIKQLLAPALSIAETFGSHLIAMSVVPPVDVIPGGAEVVPVVDESASIDYRAHNAEMRADFDAALVSRAIKPEWRDADAGAMSIAETLLPVARAVDLIIASQADSSWFGTERLDMVEPLVLESGRPVLVVPNGEARASVGTRAIVAWNGKRESARAVFDALPLLLRANAVKVVWVAQPGEEDRSELPLVDICATLARHGVKCEGAEQATASEGIGETLLASATAYNADLLVMGCYGQSRLREFIFGGASRTVLAQARIPVLMAH